jgi:hypothetical protein
VQNMNVPQHRPRGVHDHFGGKARSNGHCDPHLPSMCINSKLSRPCERLQINELAFPTLLEIPTKGFR